MRCPFCDGEDSYVADTRPCETAERVPFIRRRRECEACHRRYTTIELRAELPQRGAFSLLPISAEDLERLEEAVAAIHLAMQSRISTPDWESRW